MKPTMIIGASPNPDRYSYMATVKLNSYGHKVYPVGIREGDIEGVPILTTKPTPTDVHTVTMYLSAENQTNWIDYILSLKPKRIIFNPGAENSRFEELAKKQGVECIEACTLVMLSIGDY